MNNIGVKVLGLGQGKVPKPNRGVARNEKWQSWVVVRVHSVSVS